VKASDKGMVHITLSFILLVWLVMVWCVLLNLKKADYAARYIEDCLTQANLAALVVDPYQYGSSGELVFSDVRETKALFENILKNSMDDEETLKKLGITGPAALQEFRVYEVTGTGTAEFIFDSLGFMRTCKYGLTETVTAPDETVIEESALYARIEVPVAFLFGIELKAIKEHCVDIKNEVEDE